MRRTLVNIWKLFRLIFDSVLFSISLNAVQFENLSCTVLNFDENQLLAYYVFVIIIVVRMINSYLEWITFNHDFIKNVLLNALTCREDPNRKEKKESAEYCMNFFVFWIALIIGIFYLTCKLIVSLVRLCDVRQLFWRHINYNLNNFLKYMFQVGLYAFSIGAIIPVIIASSQCSKLNIFPIVCLGLTILRFIQRSVYFFYYQIFTPDGLEQAQITVNQNKVEPISTIENMSDTRVTKLEKGAAVGKHKRFCFSSKYVFETSFCRFVRMTEMGSMGCISSSTCSSIDLEHIFYCHDDLNIPNSLCRCCYDCTGRSSYLVGFHQTTREAALCIALSPMRISEGENGWFGDGVYFARSFDQTFLKIGHVGGKGALIVALVDMGRMKTVRDQRKTQAQRHGGTGKDEGYDSVYVIGMGPGRSVFQEVNDEFLVYDPSRIKAFIVCV